VNGLCERHTENGGIVPGKIVHHKIVLTSENIHDPTVSLNWDHLEYLCQDCHNKEHHGDDYAVTMDGLEFNEYGELVASPL
jgi:5-methylcytosine-specific restriction endonuclease McrA